MHTERTKECDSVKKVISYLLICSALMGFYVPASAQEAAWKEFYVSVNGSDTNPGTQNAPFKTVERAKKAVRAINPYMQGDIIVNIESGYYYLDNMLDFRTEDSGFNGHRVIYRGTGDTKPVLSGGRQITGFTKSEYEDIYVADADFDAVLQLSVNGKRRYVAKTATQLLGMKKPDKYNTEEWYEAHPSDSKGNDYNYFNPETEYTYDGMYLSKNDFGLYENPEDILFRWEHHWTTMICPAYKFEQDPDESEYIRVTMKPGFWNYLVGKGKTQDIYPKAHREFTVQNAFELLDEPGEFYYNRKTKKLYYMPVEGEDMSSATVIVPVLDTAIMFDGNDVTDKVKNITFENVQVSDTKWDYMEGFQGHQATSVSGIGLSAVAPRAVWAMRADGLEFKNNLFCNIGGSAIDFFNAVTNSTVIGNAFYDIGESAVLSGAVNHGDYALGSDGISNDVPEQYKNSPIDLLSDVTTKRYASFYDDSGDSEAFSNGSYDAVIYPGYGGPDDNDKTGQYDTIHRTWGGDYSYRGSWRDNVSASDGNKPYFMFEFIRPYSIDKISVSFDPADTVSGENADYEILASNDRSFKEGSYKVVATQNGTAPSAVNHYNLADGEKYKFVLIRKLTPSNFSLSRVWIETKDRKPYVKNQRCNNIVMENNIAERVGVDAARSIGLIVTHGEDFRIKHNEFKDVGYSGMSIGYSWGTGRPTCYRMDVGYNYVYDVCQVSHDGGGIYLLGPQKGSRYYNNHIERVNHGINAFYTDNGSRYNTIENNYMESILYVLSPYTIPGAVPEDSGGIMENTFRNNYATHTNTNSAAKDWNDWQDPIQEVIGQPSEAAYDTYVNAGLEEEYEYLKDLIPEGRDDLYSKYEYNRVVMPKERAAWTNQSLLYTSQELKNTLDNGKFGNGLGMYPMEYRYKLEDMISYLEGGQNADFYMRYTKVRDFQQELKSQLKRYSFNDTISVCEEKLEYAKANAASASSTGDKYPQAAIDEFEQKLSAVQSETIDSPAEEYRLLTTLENAYNTLESKKYSADIENIYVPGAESVVIDSENATATIYMPLGASMTVEGMEIMTSGDSIVARIMSAKTDISKNISVPVYCKGNNKYKIWTVRGEYTPYIESDTVTGDVWFSDNDETDMIKKGVDGSVVIPASGYAYLSKVINGDRSTKMDFRPLTNNDKNTFTLILGANSSNEFEYGSTDGRYNRCEVVFEDEKATFYKVSEGVRTAIDSVTTGIKWNEKNNLDYEIKEINNNTHFKVTLNGKLIFSEVIEKCSYGRYMGIYSPDMAVKVY